MSMHFRDLADQAAADGAITAEEILVLRQAGWADGRILPEEADAIFAINDHVAEPTAEWTDFFVEALAEFIVNGSEPRGYVTDIQGSWLIDRIDHDGKLDSMAELELLVQVLEKGKNAPDRLKTYAIEQIEQAVLTGEGPTRGGGSLDKGCISQAEARLLRRIVFARAGDRPAAVSRAEAEMLFRLKDAALGAANAPDWKLLFVQGVANYLQGFAGHDQLSGERAGELERFMNNQDHGVGRFLGRVVRSSVNGGVSEGLAELFRQDARRDFAGEAAREHEITSDENLWLQGRIDDDGRIDEYEQALRDFLAEG